MLVAFGKKFFLEQGSFLADVTTRRLKVFFARGLSTFPHTNQDEETQCSYCLDFVLEKYDAPCRKELLHRVEKDLDSN